MKTSISNNDELIRSVTPLCDCVCRELDGKMFMVPISGTVAKTADMFLLNSTGRLIWEMIVSDENKVVKIDSIASHVSERFGIEKGLALEDVNSFLSRLSAMKIVKINTP